jgi:predicted O-methyltransferase YrrM
MALRSKLKTVQWFLQRPALWGQAWILVQRKLQPNREGANDRAAATHWCEQQAQTTEAVLEHFGLVAPATSFEARFSGLMTAAHERQAQVSEFLGGPGHMTLLYEIARQTQAQRIVETGVAAGWSSLVLLQALADQGSGHLISTDMPYVQQSTDEAVGVAVPAELRAQWTLFRQHDHAALPKALARFQHQIDCFHYDSDKSYQGRAWALPRLWQALCPGGFGIIDDINDNHHFREFVETRQLAYCVTPFQNKYVGVIQKPLAS